MLVAGGIAIGVPAALASARMLSGLLSGLSPTTIERGFGSLADDFGCALCRLSASSEASQVDPMAALRHE